MPRVCIVVIIALLLLLLLLTRAHTSDLVAQAKTTFRDRFGSGADVTHSTIDGVLDLLLCDPPREWERHEEARNVLGELATLMHKSIHAEEIKYINQSPRKTALQAVRASFHFAVSLILTHSLTRVLCRFSISFRAMKRETNCSATRLLLPRHTRFSQSSSAARIAAAPVARDPRRC